jgi:hypothetical protein
MHSIQCLMPSLKTKLGPSVTWNVSIESFMLTIIHNNIEVILVSMNPVIASSGGVKYPNWIEKNQLIQSIEYCPKICSYNTGQDYIQ